MHFESHLSQIFGTSRRSSFFPPFFHGLFVQFGDLACPDSVGCFCDQSDIASSAHVSLCLKLLLLWFGKFVQSVVGEAFKSLVMAEYPYIVKTWH